jgi:hypothetical protein
MTEQAMGESFHRACGLLGGRRVALIMIGPFNGA